jgi:hypothetical protein
MWLLQSQDPEAWGRLREVLRQARVLGLCFGDLGT